MTSGFNAGLEHADLILTKALQSEDQGEQCALVAEALLKATARLDDPSPGRQEAQGLLVGVIFAALRDARARLWALKTLEHVDDATAMH